MTQQTTALCKKTTWLPAISIAASSLVFLFACDKKGDETNTSAPDPIENVETSQDAATKASVVMDLPTNDAERKAFVVELEKKLEEFPTDIGAWVIFGRSHFKLKNYDQAIAAMQKANSLTNYSDVAILAEHAQMLVLKDEGQVKVQAYEMYNMILSIDPDHPHAHYFLGLFQAQNGKPRLAVKMWQERLDTAPEGAEWAPVLQQRIDMMQQVIDGKASGTNE